MIQLCEKCSGCMHHTVCKYSSTYIQKYEEIEKYYNDNIVHNSDNVLLIDVSCRHFVKTILLREE